MAKILIVDDEPDFRMILSYVLGQAGHTIVEATDGEEALKLIKGSPPDLFIIDWNMPRMNGPELCQAIRQDQELCTLPVVMLTVRGQDIDHVEGLHAGADLYLIKPVDPIEIVSRIKSLLKKVN
ncbi:MAG: response regulator transcription factor [Elusimicrobiota bacterium]